MDSIRPIDPRDRNPEQFLRVERLREERDAPERRERKEGREAQEETAAKQPAPAPDAPRENPGDEPGEGSLIDVRV